MSRSKEGLNRPANAEPARQNEPTPGANLNERLGALGQTDYTGGRESYREFPRRSTSLRGRSDREIESRDLYSTPSRGSYEGRRGTGSRYRGQEYNRGGRYSPYDRGESRGRFGHHTYNDLRSGRSDYEDFNESRYARGRGYDYDRERDYRSDEQLYDDPYNRQALSGRYDNYEQNYEPTLAHMGWGMGRDEDEDFEDRRGDRYGRYQLRCSDVMTKNVTVTTPAEMVREVADKMEDENVGSLPVVDNGRLIGIVTDRDIVCRVVAQGLDTRTTPVSEAMSQDIVTCSPDDSIIEAVRKMGEHQVRRIPVCDMNGRLRGIIAMADVALEAERDRDLADALERISQPTPNRSRRI